MDRDAIVRRIGYEYRTSNIEAGEYSYVQEAGSMEKLVSLLGHKPKHFKLDTQLSHNFIYKVAIKTDLSSIFQFFC